MRQSPPPLTRERVVQLIQRMKSSRVVVVGDIMLDRYLVGETERLSPEAPVPVVTVRERTAALGGAANVAANVIALGARCLLVGAVGDDTDCGLQASHTRHARWPKPSKVSTRMAVRQTFSHRA